MPNLSNLFLILSAWFPTVDMLVFCTAIIAFVVSQYIHIYTWSSAVYSAATANINQIKM